MKLNRIYTQQETISAQAEIQVAAADCACQDKALRDQMSEKQLDKMIKDSFPASDPPSTY